MIRFLTAFFVSMFAILTMAPGADAKPLARSTLNVSEDAGSNLVLVQGVERKKANRKRKKKRNNANNRKRRKTDASAKRAKNRKQANKRRNAVNRKKAKRNRDVKRRRNANRKRTPAQKRAIQRKQKAARNRGVKRNRNGVRVNKTTRIVRTGRRRNITVRDRRIVTRRGGTRIVRSRRVVVVDRRYRNRYYRGRSIYYRPPVGAAIVASAFVVSAAIVSASVIHQTLAAPPVVQVRRRYTVNEIVQNPEIRQKVRSVDLDSIKFASGQAQIAPSEYGKLEHIAGGMQRVLQDKSDQVFLIEGHTDAVGESESNLGLSEDRAASVKLALVEEYGIGENNIEAVGYGEQYLKIDTGGPARENRRVTIRNISGLVARDRDPEIAQGDGDPEFDDQGTVDRERELIEREKELIARERELLERERALDGQDGGNETMQN